MLVASVIYDFPQNFTIVYSKQQLQEKRIIKELGIGDMASNGELNNIINPPSSEEKNV